MQNEPQTWFSPEQLDAIATPARETLVSAGAGSGKTSAVTQRVVNLVSGADPDEYRRTGQISVSAQNGTDIRKMLIVTFTNAGASEMRTRIAAALEKAADEQPAGSEEQKWLAAQADAALSADIGTIHSICGRILRDHYETTGIAPDFDILDDNAGKKLRKECANEAVNELLAADPGRGHALLRRFGPSANDVSKKIDRLVGRAESQPHPDEWIRRHYPEDTEAEAAEQLGELVLRTREMYREKKKELGLADYADLEHLTLETVRMLREQGVDIGSQYQYIFVDEYQDVNPVQEELVQAIGADSIVFMVGDMKQSIYGFRFAAPENFAAKNDRFCAEDNAEQMAVHMNRNYRSTPAVVGFTNAVMRRLMSEDLGGVSYDEKHTLICSRKDKDENKASVGHAEILVTAGKEKEEARMIADKIHELHKNGRPYEDMIILSRALTGASAKMIHRLRELLHSRGVKTMIRPEANSTVETEIFLNLLRLLDNPNQDVPLLSVMRSVFFKFDETDFSRIAAWEPEEKISDGQKRRYRSFSRALYDFEKAGREDELQGDDRELYKRLKAFEHTLQQFRDLLLTMSVRDAAAEIARRLDFRTYLLVQPDGPEREAAFDDLLDQLQAEEQISGSSLHAILDGFEQNQKKRNPPMGAVPGVVRIMTIHASKGLEFPVVFLANAGNDLTTAKEDAIQSTDRYGITVKGYVEDNCVLRKSNASTAVKQHRQELESSEQLRLLYVALTRARDEIYVCGREDEKKTDPKDEKKKGAKGGKKGTQGESKESMLKWVKTAWEAAMAEEEPEDDALRAETDVLRSAFRGELWQMPVVDDISSAPAFVALPTEESTPVQYIQLKDRKRVASAVSVTEKHGAHDTEKQKKRNKDAEPSEAGGAKNVVRDGLGGAERGTLLHHVLQWVMSRQVSLDEAIQQMQAGQLLTKRGLRTLENDRARLETFLSSELGKRAAASDTLVTERNFLLEVDPEDGADAYGRKTLLKGMIDLAFLEDGAWTIVDYKSDADADPERLRERHGAQLQTYKRALEELTGHPVKDTYVFSLTSGETVSMED